MIVKCMHCGVEKEFKPSVAKKRKFCSAKCRKEFYLCTCPICNKIFKPHHPAKANQDTTCSIECRDVLRKSYNGQDVICHNCGTVFRKPNSLINERNFCDKACWLEFWTQNRGWITAHGYRYICVNNVEIFEHRYVMEQYLNRPLETNEVVHHINGDRLDNRIKNLELMTRSEHTTHHNLERAANGLY